MNKILRYLPSIVLLAILVIACLSLAINKFLFIFCLIVVLFIFFAEFIYYLLTYKREINIETPDGSNQPYHPSVLFFEHGWNGWKYWMAFTPMPIGKEPYTDRWECPCVVVSNDGVNWQYPDKKQYLDDLTEEEIANRDYFSDTHLVYDNKNDCILLYYRLSKVTRKWTDITLYRKVSRDGINWSDREKILYNDSIVAQRPTSPAIIQDITEDVYKFWFVTEMLVGDKHDLYYALSPDGVNIETSTLVNFSDYNIDPWHIDCQFIDGKYYLIVFSLDERLTLFESNNGIDFTFNKILLAPSNKVGSFYKKGLYRSCLINDNEGYKLYFSAKDGRRVCIGLMEGNEIHGLQVVSAQQQINYKAFLTDIFEKYCLFEIRIATIVKRFFR